MVTYTVAVCNYNMARTLEPSLRSILDQLNDDFEVVVVDGGSTDDSISILQKLSTEYDCLRVIQLDPDPDRRLGADRQRAVEASAGEYVLVQLDVDDLYQECILDFVNIYHQLENKAKDQFFLSGNGLNMAPQSLLLEIPYRNLASSEDRDLWRRLFAHNSIYWLKHKQPYTEIGYEKSTRDALARDFSGKVADAQAGISMASAIEWALTGSQTQHGVLESNRSGTAFLAKRLFDLVSTPLAYVIAEKRESYSTPSPFDEKGKLDREIERASGTLDELAEQIGSDIDYTQLSETGCRIFQYNCS